MDATHEAGSARPLISTGSREAEPDRWMEGRPRRFDDDYQQDILEYFQLMRNLLRLLAARSDGATHAKLLTLPLRILNRGRVEAFVAQDTVFVDIALLDLIWIFSFEQGVADVKRDPYHLIEFALTYADALHTERSIEQLDPYNTARLSEAQFRQLWADARHVQRIAFENTLAFVLAHEVGHLLLAHEDGVRKAFPDPRTRRLVNGRWVIWRTRAELAADRFAALLSLDALYQPAQVIPWFDLVETRRSYYGSSAEYPTPGQRASTIWSAYAERFGGDGIDTSGLSRVDPLPPDRDMTKVDRARNLQNVRQVRSFRRNFLAELDGQVSQLLDQGVDAETAATLFADQAEGYRQLLYGADDPDAIEEALSRIDASGTVTQALVEDLRALFARAFLTPQPADLLSAPLEVQPVELEDLRQLLVWARDGQSSFADALEMGYLLANTRFRWEPVVFEAMLAHMTRSQPARLRLAPYYLGTSAHQPRPTFNERLEVLERWDGSYSEAYEAMEARRTSIA